MSQLLKGKIAAVRFKHSLVESSTGAAMAAGAFVGLLTLAALADWWIDFPWLLRALLLLGYLAATGYLAWKHCITPVVKGPDDEEIALRVEHEEPGFASRLISAVQFSAAETVPSGASPALVQAMIRQTEDMARNMDFARVIKIKRCLQFVSVAVITLGIAGTLFASGGSTARDLVARIFLSNTVLPTKTRVQCLSGSFTIAHGDDAVLTAKAEGWRPSLGRAEITYASGQTQSLILEQSKEDSSLYSATLNSVQDSFSYRIRIYDGKSPETYQVKATPRPAVVDMACSVIYPAYTKLGTVNKPTGDLSVLVGSKLHLKVTANKDLRVKPDKDGESNYAIIYNTDKNNHETKIPMTVNPAKRTELTGDLPLVPGTVAFALHLVDDDGITSKDAAVYRIDLVPDRPPVVRIIIPDRKEVLVTRQSEMEIRYLAEDDFGVAKLTLHYRVDEGEEKTIPLPLDATNKSIRGKYIWSISNIPLPPGKPALEGSVMEYWLEAEDLNDVTGPLKSTTEHYQARVVSKNDKQKELIERMGDQLNIMKSITERQDDTSRDLGNVIEQQGAPATPH